MIKRLFKILSITLLFRTMIYGTIINKIYVVDARELSLSDKLTIVSIQGIVNKVSKEYGVFIILRSEDERWLKDVKNRRKIETEILIKKELIEKFKHLFSGQIIYDKNTLYTVNIATTLAGIRKAFISDTPVKGFDIIFDCRNKWKDKIEAYQWAVKNLLNKANKDIVAILEENIVSLRDFIISENIFVFDLDPINNEREIEFIQEILSQFKPASPIIGWPDAKYADKNKGQNNVSVEVAFVKLISPKNIFLVASDFANNLSIYKKMKSELPLLQIRRKLKYDPDKVYLTFVYSDGDNVQYVLNWMRSELWDDLKRTKIPLGWTIAPLLYDWAGFVLEKYYTDALLSGNDEFVMGPSGFGYIHPSHYGDIDRFLKLTKDYAQKMDISSVAIIDEGRGDELIPTFIKFGDQSSLKTIFGVGNIEIDKILQGDNTGILVLSEDMRANFVDENINRIRQLVSSGRKMIYSYAHAWDIRPSYLVKIVEGLSDLNLEVVTPSSFSDLYLQKSLQDRKENKAEQISQYKFFDSEKKLIYKVKGRWDKTYKIPLYTITAKIPSSGILTAEVIYWFNNKKGEYFQYMTHIKDNFWKATLPPIYEGTNLYYYIEIITKDFKFEKSSVFATGINFKDTDNDKLDDNYEEYVVKSNPHLRDTDDDGLYDGNDFEPLNPFVQEKMLSEISLNKEKEYLWKDYKSKVSGDGHRFVDNDAYVIYRFIFPKGYQDLTFGITSDNNYVIEASSDGKDFIEIFRANYEGHDGANRSLLKWKIPVNFFNSEYLYIKISDGSTENGWGGGFYSAMFMVPAGDVNITQLNLYPAQNFYVGDEIKISGSISFKQEIRKIILEAFSPDNKKINLSFTFNTNSQNIDGIFFPDKLGVWKILLRVEDIKGNRAEKEVAITIKEKIDRRTARLFGKIEFLNKNCIEIEGWDEGECGTFIEKAYIEKDNGTAIDQNMHRFADKNMFVIYKFPVYIKGTGLLRLSIGNNYIVSVSSDSFNWIEILNAEKIYGEDIHDLSNYEEHIVNISRFIDKESIYIKLEDGSASDGWGVNIGKMKFLLPPLYQPGEQVIIIIEPLLKEIEITANCSNIYKRKMIISSRDYNYWFKEDLNIMKNVKYLRFSIPYNTKPGTYPILITGKKGENIDNREIFISVVKEIPKIKPKKKVAIQKPELEEFVSEYLVDENYIKEKKLKIVIQGWEEGRCGSPDEKKYLILEGGAINEDGHRFGDGNSFYIYQFKLKKPYRKVIAAIKAGNNFVIQTKIPDSNQWVEILRSDAIYKTDIHDISNLKFYYLDITSFIDKNLGFQLKFTDGSPNDGWGSLVSTIHIYGG